MTLSIFTERVYTSQGVPISVIGTAQVVEIDKDNDRYING